MSIEKGTKLNVLDKGFITFIDALGQDLTVVNAARISFGKEKKVFDSADEKLIKYLCENDHTCYDEKTEVFTSNGWKAWKDIGNTDLLAAVLPDGTFRFELPKRLIASEYTGKMLLVERNGVDFCVTPNHNIWAAIQNAFSFCDFELVSAEDSFNKRYKIKTTARFTPESESGNYDEGFIYGFFLGSGSRLNENKITLSAKNKKSLKFLQESITKLNLAWEEIENETLLVTTSDPLLIESPDNKHIDATIFNNKSIKFLSGLFDGLLGSSDANEEYPIYYTTSEHLAIDFQRLGVLLNKNITITKNQTGYYSMAGAYLTGEYKINNGTVHNNWVDYTGNIYCAEVSTGLLLVRRNGNQIISGNSPFRHSIVQLHIKAPIFVLRQLMKYRVGSEFNEISGRYIEFNDSDIYIPDVYRKQSTSNKQGSFGKVDRQESADHIYRQSVITAMSNYKSLIGHGVCREQARAVLPLGLYSEVYWTASLQTICHVINQRMDSHAQWEIQQYALALKQITTELFPVSSKYLLTGVTNVE